jgi:hypothetical protein
VKSVVYSWRVSPELLTALEGVARREGVSVAALLDRLASQCVAVNDGEDDENQARLHALAAKSFGSIHGGSRDRAERSRELVVARIKQRHGR